MDEKNKSGILCPINKTGTRESLFLDAIAYINGGPYMSGEHRPTHNVEVEKTIAEVIGKTALLIWRRKLLFIIVGVFMGAIFLTISLNIPTENVNLFRIMLSVTCIFIPLASPNIATTVYDVVLPEIRSTSTSIQYFPTPYHEESTT